MKAVFEYFREGLDRAENGTASTRSVVELSEFQQDAVKKARDHYTGQHTRQVARLTLQLALALGLDASEAYMIGMAGRLHDVGKVAVPDAVLQKPGPLTEKEWEFMRRHPEVGADVVSRVPSLRTLAPVIRAHHEQWMDKAIPTSWQARQSPLGARIVAVADAYHAMMTNRPYQPARNAASALAEAAQVTHGGC